MPTHSSTPIEEAEALLRRNLAVTIVQLLKLIREVNPTSRGLANSDRRRRYALKAKLQSLLIRRFPDGLRVVLADDPGVVELLQGHTGADACHAVIEELDEDARSWVTYKLDIGAVSEAESGTNHASHSPSCGGDRATATHDDVVTTLVAAGHRALAEYDYDLAAAHFERAQQTSQGAIEPTRALLEFWIEQMGADQAALELESRLPRATLADAKVRELLAIAAARTKDIQRAARLTRGLDGARTPEVMGLCARAALEMGDPESASEWMARLRSLDPMNPAIGECERELRRLRDEERVAAETELQRLQVSCPLDEVEQCAKKLLQRWPHNELALTWLRERTAERAGAAAIQAIEHAECERARGALRKAALILSRALVPELDQELRTVVQEKHTEIDRQLREAADNGRVTEVTATLRSILAGFTTLSMSKPSAESGLATYFDLPACLRERVRENVSRLELGWVEPILIRQGARRAKTAAVAVLALVELKVDFEQHPAEALTRLQPYLEVLESMPESSRLVAQAKHRVRLQRHALAVEQLHQAQQALVESTAEQALRLLEAVLPEDLESIGQKRRRELLTAARALVEQKELASRLDSLHRQGDLFGARDIASQLADRTDGDEQLTWICHHNELRDEIARVWCTQTGLGEIGDFWQPSIRAPQASTAPEPWVEPGGLTAICFVHTGRWLLLVRYQLESARVESWARLLLPKPVESVDLKRVTDEVVILATDKVEVLVVDLRSWEILAFYESPVSEVWETVTSVVSRDARWLWCAQYRSGRNSENRVQALEIASRRVVRTFDEADLIPVVGAHDAEVCVIHEDCVTMHCARGAPLPGHRVSEPLAAVAQAPSGSGLVGAIEDDDCPNSLVFLGPMPAGRSSAELILEGSSFGSFHQLAVALDDSVLVARYCANHEEWLEGFVEANGCLVSLYRVPVSGTALLLSDRAGRCAWVMGIEGRRLIARRIGREPPRLEFDCLPRRKLEQASAPSWVCFHQYHQATTSVPSMPLETTPDVWQVAQSAQLGGAAALRAIMPEMWRLLSSNELTQVGLLLRLALRWAFPDDPEVLLDAAETHTQLDNWADAHRCLRNISTVALPEHEQQHALHLTAMCALMGRDFAKARELRQMTAPLKGQCEFSIIDEHADPIVDTVTTLSVQSAPGATSNEDSAIAILRRALRDADAFLGAGEPRAAFDAANLPELFDWADERLLACAAESLMQFEPEGVGERLHREYVLSALLASSAGRLPNRFPIPVPEGWDGARIATVRERAARQLALDMGTTLSTFQAIRPTGETPDAEIERPPLLGHERMLDLHPGLMQALGALLEQLRGEGPAAVLRTFSEVELLADPRVWRMMETERARLIKEGESEPGAISKLSELGPHIGYVVNHSLAGRRCYWVDGKVARLFREPSPGAAINNLATRENCRCFVFTDRDTLQIGQQLLARDRRCRLAAKPITAITAYTWQIGAESCSPTLAVRLLFGAEERTLAYLVSRELQINTALSFDTIVNSHCTDTLEGALDPVVGAPELNVLLGMVLRGVLHVTDPRFEIQEVSKCTSGAPKNVSSSAPAHSVSSKGSSMPRTADHLLFLPCPPED